MSIIHLIRLKNYPILDQLRLEEALLRADQRNWCLMNEGTSPAIVMGISGDPNLLINQSILQKMPVPVIRRFSGGGTVFVDENTCFITMICNQENVSVPCFPEPILKWNAGLYEGIFSGHPFGTKENDYVLGHRKWGGNAQYLTKKRWLHHSSLLWDYDEKNMDYLNMPLRMPKYRDQRKHGDFLCKLCEYLPSKSMLFNGVRDRIRKDFDVIEVSEKVALEVINNPHRQSTVVL